MDLPPQSKTADEVPVLKSYSSENSRALLNSNVRIQQNCIVGFEYKENCAPAEIGNDSTLRSGTIIYGDVKTGDNLQTGHHVVIREHTKIGKYVVVGTNTVIDGNVEIGDFVKIESNCYIPTHVKIGNRVFIGPNVTMTNDRFPLKMRDDYLPKGPTIENGVTIGGGVTICPGINIGKGSFIAAGALVTKNVPANSLVIGSPATIKVLPDNLKEPNTALNWRKMTSELPII